MKISINIPTYRRAGGVTTFDILPGAHYWVHNFELNEYRIKYPDMILRVLPDEIRGNIASVRNYILTKTAEEDVSVQIDDDVSYLAYWEKQKIIKLNENQILAVIERNSLVAREWGARLWGINVSPDKQVYREYTPFSTISYVSGSFSCFLKGNELHYDERFPLKEDYDMTLQQLNRYRIVLRFNKFFYAKKSAENTGGCAMYRNISREMDQIADLQRKWGKRIVRIDSLDSSKSHSTVKIRKFDINPIIKVPIGGV